MTFEFEGSRLVALLTNQMRPGKRQGEQGYEFIQSLGGRHAGVFEIKTTRLQGGKKCFDFPPARISQQRLVSFSSAN